MITKEKIQEIIYISMDEIKDMINDDEGKFKKNPETVLYGAESSLDSMATVALIINIEQKFNEEFNKEITIASEKAVSAKNSPFKNISSLTDYIFEISKDWIKMKNHTKPVTIITGTRKGIGKYLVEYYHDLGHIIIGCSRGESSIQLPNYEHYRLDVADEKLVTKMVRDVKLKHGKIDNLINNAGIASMNHFLLTPLNTVNNIFNTNVVGTILFTREVAKIMATKKNGRIINFSTVAVPLNLEGEAIYASSKAAIVSLTKILAKELASFNITVNAIGPTPIETDLIKNIPQNKIDDLLKKQAINRFGNFKDVHNVIDFFLKKESDFVTGQIVYLGGL